MEIEIYQAFLSVGVPAEKAQMAADSVRHEINERFAANIQTLATKHDLAAAVADIELAASQLSAKTEAAIASLSAKTDASFARVDARFEKLDTRLDKLDTRLDKLEKMIDLKIDLKFESMVHQMSALIAQSRDISLRWTIGSMFALVACAGGVSKLFVH